MTVAHAAAFVNTLEDAAHEGTGCLFVADGPGARSGRVFLRDGKVYSVHVDGFMPKIGQRLVTGGMLTADQYDHLLTLVGGNVYAPQLGVLAVENGFVTDDVLVAVSREILLSSVGAMFTWETPKAKFKRNAETDQFTVPPISVTALAKAVAKRRARWEELWNEVAPGLTPESTFPSISPMYRPTGEETSPEIVAVLAAADATRSLDDMAGVCGLTRFEIAHVLGHLVGSGTLDMNDYPAGDATTVEAETHGTAEAALSENADTVLDRVETDPEVESDAVLHESHPQPEPEGPCQSGPLFADEDDSPAPHFAPDVIETVTHVPDDAEIATEPSAFGGVEETFPDGMDLGTIPTDQIENDPDDPPATSDTPPLTGMTDHQYTPEAGGFYVAEMPVTETAPAPMPVDVPHYAEPVPPVAAPADVDVSQEPEVTEGPMVAPPAEAPVFVDASTMDHSHADREPSMAVAGMPGVPLPPLPAFLPTPVPVETEDTGETVEESETPESIYTDPEQSIDDTIVEPVHAPAPPEPTGDERLDSARRRLYDEIAADTRMVEAAESALARIEADHAAHIGQSEQVTETLTGYRAFLDEATADKERLLAEAAQVDAEKETLAADLTAAEAEAEAATEAETAAQEKVVAAAGAVVAAREALRLAEQSHAEAETELARAAEAQTVVSGKVDDVLVRVTDLTVRAEQVAADVAEVEERVSGYESEVAQVTETAATIEAAVERVAELREDAVARLDAARANLAAKQDRLAQLG